MYIAHSNIKSIPEPEQVPQKPEKPKALTPEQEFDREMAYKGFKKACKKYEKEIAEIQQYFPNWMPNLIIK